MTLLIAFTFLGIFVISLFYVTPPLRPPFVAGSNLYLPNPLVFNW